MLPLVADVHLCLSTSSANGKRVQMKVCQRLQSRCHRLSEAEMALGVLPVTGQHDGLARRMIL